MVRHDGCHCVFLLDLPGKMAPVVTHRDNCSIPDGFLPGIHCFAIRLCRDYISSNTRRDSIDIQVNRVTAAGTGYTGLL